MDRDKRNIGDLCQRWVHSYEEDTDSESVYRPAGYAFPPSRGRIGFELLTDKSCKRVEIAAGDGSKVTNGTWEFEGENTLRIRINCKDTNEVMTVASLSHDRLAIRKEPRSGPKDRHCQVNPLKSK